MNLFAGVIKASRSLLVLSLYLNISLAMTVTLSADWTRFRGPNGQGKSQVTTIPTTLDAKTQKWEVKLPGPGHSSPVILGKQLFVTSEHPKRTHITITCFDALTGQKQWQSEHKTGEYHLHKFNDTASASPAVDESGVYISWFNGQTEKLMLAALTLEGQPKWQTEVGPFISQHGATVSPTVIDGKVIMPCLNMENSFVAAYDSKDGKRIWKMDRGSGKSSYGSPTVLNRKGRKELVFASQADGMYALYLSDGKLAWEARNLFKMRTVAGPVIADGLLVMACGSGGSGKFLAAVKPGTMEVPGKKIWDRKKALPYVVSPVADSGILYLLADGGLVTALEARTGTQYYSQRIDGNKRSTFFASPLFIDGKIYCLSREGAMYVLKSGKKFELISKTQLGEGPAYATPAIAHGMMYVRIGETLKCFGG